MSILDDYQDQLPEGALRQVGAHYLWGAAGHMPEATSGILTGSANAARFANRVHMRPNTVDRRNPTSSPPLATPGRRIAVTAGI